MKKISIVLVCFFLSLLVASDVSGQIIYNFTTAGTAGNTGPTQSAVNAAYTSTTLAGQVTATAGIQYFTIPTTGIYRFRIAGAKGGDGAGHVGGKGARMQGEITLTAGTVIKIIVGQTGGSRFVADPNSAGAGGGGTFVAKADNTPLIVAGGGGGGGINVDGLPGDTGLDGTSGGAPQSAGAGGINGGGGGGGRNGTAGTQSVAGGVGASCSYGAGGGGFYTRGGYNCTGTTPNINGEAFLNGGLGGGIDVSRQGVAGGFGGGAGVGHRAAAGGGWSGGGGDGNAGGGGGGGSYNSGTNPSNLTGENNGDGYVTMTLLYGVNITQTSAITCPGAANASLTAAAIGGTSPYSYSWSNGAITATISNLAAGSYTVTATDAALQTTQATFVVADPASVVITGQPQNTVVISGSNTTISASATGPGLLYRWQADTGSGYADVSNGGIYSNVTSATLSLTGPTTLYNGYLYRVGVRSGTCTEIFSDGVTLTVNKRAQAITFNALPGKVFGDAPYALTATGGGSGSPVTFVSSNTAVATISGSTVTIVGAGTTNITASQAGDSDYNASPDVVQSLSVSKANQTITFGALANKTFGDAPSSLTGTSNSGLSVTYISSNPSVATVSGNIITIVGVGTTNITASQTGDVNYNSATNVVQALTVVKANQAIVFAALANKTYGDPSFTLSATGGDSGNTVTYVSSNPGVATVSGNTVTIVSVGSVNITASQAGNGNYNAAADVVQALTVDKAAQSITFGALGNKTYGDGTFTLSATGGASGNTVTYVSSNTGVATVSGNTVTVISAGTTNITASQTGNANYNAAPNSVQPLTITAKPVTVTADAKTKVYGAADPALTYTISPALIAGDSFSGALSRTGGENVGSYAINQGTLALSVNYTISYVPANLTITAKPVTVTADAKSKVYGSADPALTYTFSPALIAGDSFSGALSRTGGENVGSYAINQGTLALSVNYTISYVPANLTITAKSVTVTADAKTKVYGAADPALTYTFSPALIAGDSFTGALSRTGGENVGAYAINKNTLALSSNYTLTYVSANLTITSKALTITADNKSRQQGVANPPLTASYSGFVNGETNAVLTTQPSLSTTATIASPQGNYPIIPSGAAAQNYSIAYVNGTLSVTPGNVTSVSLAAAALYENRPAGTLAGTLSSTSDDPNATFTYTLVSGTGSTDNASFSISGSQVLTTAPLNFENKPAYSIRVRSTTQFGLSLEQVFTINLLNVNEVPTISQVAEQITCYSANSQNIALAGISAGPDAGQSTALSFTNSNAGIFNSFTVTNGTGGAGVISYTMKSGTSGIATITVTVQDNGGTANGGTDQTSMTFTLTVNALPVVNITSDKGSNDLSKGDVAILTATGGTSYAWANAAGIMGSQTSASLTVKPLSTTTYTVTATNASGCSTSQSFTVNVLEDFKTIDAANIMSPNGDGVNDFWVIKNIELYPNNEVKVFDRAGRIVFSKKGYANTWDATVNGSPLAEGTYYYAVDFGAGKMIQKGYITLIRTQ